MQITTLTGHLTATEKTHLKIILERGLMEAKVNRKNYFLTYVGSTKDQISVKIKENAKNDFGEKIILSNTSTFIYKT